MIFLLSSSLLSFFFITLLVITSSLGRGSQGASFLGGFFNRFLPFSSSLHFLFSFNLFSTGSELQGFRQAVSAPPQEFKTLSVGQYEQVLQQAQGKFPTVPFDYPAVVDRDRRRHELPVTIKNLRRKLFAYENEMKDLEKITDFDNAIKSLTEELRKTKRTCRRTTLVDSRPAISRVLPPRHPRVFLHARRMIPPRQEEVHGNADNDADMFPDPPEPPPVVFRQIDIDIDWLCSICQCEFDENVVTVDCGHSFHRLCIERHATTSGQNGHLPCSLCRQHLPLPLSLVPVEVLEDDVVSVAPSVVSVTSTVRSVRQRMEQSSLNISTPREAYFEQLLPVEQPSSSLSSSSRAPVRSHPVRSEEFYSNLLGSNRPA